MRPHAFRRSALMVFSYATSSQRSIVYRPPIVRGAVRHPILAQSVPLDGRRFSSRQMASTHIRASCLLQRQRLSPSGRIIRSARSVQKEDSASRSRNSASSFRRAQTPARARHPFHIDTQLLSFTTIASKRSRLDQAFASHQAITFGVGRRHDARIVPWKPFAGN